MIDFYKESSNKQWLIEYDEGTITNTDIYQRSISINESISSGAELRFGGVEACSFSVTLRNDGTTYIGKWLTVKISSQNQTMLVGKYKVASETLSADKSSRKLVAYDEMYDFLSMNLANWYSNEFISGAKTIKQFRDDLFTHLGIQQETATLCNDNVVIGKTVTAEKLLGKTILQALCEINGCFGHINRAGKFEYVVLKPMEEGITPSLTLVPLIDLTPKGATNASEVPKGKYISAQYDDFRTAIIDKIQIRQDTDDIGGIYGTGDNCYIIQDNFLCYGMSTNKLQDIGHSILDVIGGIWYTPSSIEAVGNLNLNVGDGVYVVTKNGTFMTYILDRCISGSQSMRDKYYARGKEYQTEKVNSVNESIINSVGKTNRLTRTVEELSIQLNDEKEGLQSQITQNANNIKLIVKQSFEGNMITDDSIGEMVTFPKNQYAGMGFDVVYGKGFTIDNSVDRTVGTIRMSATQYTISFLYRSNSEDWASPALYLVDSSGNETELDMVAYSVFYDWWFNSATFTIPASGDYSFKFTESNGMDVSFSDLMLSTGELALEWSPNRSDEWSMISQTTDSISAKVEKTGGDASSFAWELESDHFSLTSNNAEIFRCDEDGINVNGYATIDYIQTEVLDAMEVTAGNIVSSAIQTNNASIANLYATKTYAESLVAGKLSASDASITYATIANLTTTNTEIKNIKTNYLKTSDLTADKIIGTLGGMGGTISIGTVKTNTFVLGGRTIIFNEGYRKNNLGQNVYMKWLSWN